MPFSVPQYVSVVIIGAGQAGLSVSYCLRQRGLDDHVIFEKNRVGHSWQADGSGPTTPCYPCPLPGLSSEAKERTRVMTKDEAIRQIESYMKKFRPPVLEKVSVNSVRKEDGYFRVATSQALWYCDDVVVATGGQTPPNFSFIELPVFNMRGFPEAEHGVTAIPGLYFLGLPWMQDFTEDSGIAEDAEYIAEQIAIGVENDLNPPGTRPAATLPDYIEK